MCVHVHACLRACVCPSWQLGLPPLTATAVPPIPLTHNHARIPAFSHPHGRTPQHRHSDPWSDGLLQERLLVSGAVGSDAPEAGDTVSQGSSNGPDGGVDAVEHEVDDVDDIVDVVGDDEDADVDLRGHRGGYHRVMTVSESGRLPPIALFVVSFAGDLN